MRDDGQPTLEEIVQNLLAIQADLNAQVETLRAQLDQLTQEKRRINQIVRAATGTGAYSPKPKPQRSKGISEETLERVWEMISEGEFEGVTEDLPGTFTHQQIADLAGVTPTTIRLALRELRDQGRVRLVGERRLNPQGSRTTMIFAANA
jgi:CRP-like cAMP-binding protein